MEFTSFTQADKLGLPKIEDPKRKALCRVLFRPYFFRVWIIQEILAAKQCIVQCGSHIVDQRVIFAITNAADKFHFISNMITANVPMGDSVEDNTPEEFTIDELRDLFSPPNSSPSLESFPVTGFSLLVLLSLKSRIDAGDRPTILDLLMDTRMFKATQPCDKIFALVGLASDISPNFINYKKSPADVQVEFAEMGYAYETELGANATLIRRFETSFRRAAFLGSRLDKRRPNARPLYGYFLPWSTNPKSARELEHHLECCEFI
jgi:hypothetical protein